MAESQGVAITVFCEITGDVGPDSYNVAEQAIRRQLAKAGPTMHIEFGTPLLKSGHHPYEAEVEAVLVMETGRAAGNGYLWQKPSVKAFRDAGKVGVEV
jgi:hypothetical protein